MADTYRMLFVTLSPAKSIVFFSCFSADVTDIIGVDDVSPPNPDSGDEAAAVRY